MRFLLLISLLLGFSTLAKAFPDTEQTTDSTNNDTQFFSATIDVYGRQLSGIMVFNNENNDKHRILFTTTTGPKLLDMYITADSYKKIYCIKKLNKKLILKFLQKDFAVVTFLHRKNKEYPSFDGQNTPFIEKINVRKADTVKYHYITNNQITKAEYISKNKKLFDVDYVYEQDKLQTIKINHYNFKMTITLNRLEQ